MTENQHNEAYQLLVEKYVQNPTPEEIELCKTLFTEWCESGNQNLLSHLIEFIENHESNEIRELAMETLKKTLPKEARKNVIELWINHPTPTMTPYIRSILKSTKLPAPLVAASYLMLDEWDLLEQIDPEHELIDQYVKDLDPLMGSLLYARINQLKSFEIYETTLETKNIDELGVNVNESLLDKVRSKDYVYLWENLLQYPFPFICELLKIFNEDSWVPHTLSDLEIYETLLEQVGTKGWTDVERIKWMVISKKDSTKFKRLSDLEIRNRQFELLIAPELISRPDRIEAKEVNIRGYFNLVNPDIDLHIYQETIRKSDIDGLLHIPIYTNNGVEIAEFMIPAVNTNSFNMDEDGLYFTVRNQLGLFSVDVDALATILLPVSNHSEAVTEIIPSLREKARKSDLTILNALELLSSLHRGREFTLWNLKEKGELKDVTTTEIKCKCVLGVDVGDYMSKISYVPDVECGGDIRKWSIPSIIHFKSLNEFVIGNDVFNQKLENSSQTFTYWKSGLYTGINKFLRIRHTKISAQKAFEYFLSQALEDVVHEINHIVPSLSFTYGMELPLGLQRWIISIIKKLGFIEVNLVENLTSLILAEYKLANQRGNFMMIDIGSSQMSAAIVSAESKKSRKRNEIEKFREEQKGKPLVIAKISTRFGSEYLTRFLSELDENHSEIEFEYFNNLKHKLSYEFDATLELPIKKKQLKPYSIQHNPKSDTINVREEFQASQVFLVFKLLIRNIIAKSALRGMEKSKLDKIIISGDGAQWPIFLEYLFENFQDKELLIETDEFYAANGGAIATLGQSWDFYSERDYLLKTTSEGMTTFETVIERGEQIINSYKNFEIRQKARFEHVVLDCWSRIPKFVNDPSVLPMKDGEYLDHRKSDSKQFDFDRIHRDLSVIDDDTILSITVTDRSHLLIKLTSDNLDKTIDLQTFIH